MGIEGGLKCVKYLLVIFNVIFWICGLALVVLGVLVQVGLHSTIVMKDVSASAAPIVLIVVGVVIFFIAFFGCCGAWKENYCMVTMFSILLTLIIIVEIAACIAAYVFRGKLSDVVNGSLKEMVHGYKNNTSYQQAVDKMQQDMKCCGVNSSADWDAFKPDHKSVPDSCCIKVTKNCGTGTMTDAAKVYIKGCHDALEQVLKKNLMWIIVAAAVIAVLQILGIVFSCLLMKGIRSGYEVM